jgi:hypothetical protein
MGIVIKIAVVVCVILAVFRIERQLIHVTSFR